MMGVVENFLSKEIKIDEEFKSILFPLSAEDYKHLEESLVNNGFSKAFPLVVWKGQNILVDGHNRYEICKKHKIPFSVSEEEFADRDSVVDYILRMQLGRRNMSDFQRIEIALRYQDIISKKAKKNAEEGRERGRHNRYSGLGSKDPKPPSIDTNEELSKIAGTSRASVIRTKRILRDGTDEQIEKARSGEKTITATDREIREKKQAMNKTMRCIKCGKTKPLSEFSRNGRDHKCKKCEALLDREGRKRRKEYESISQLVNEVKDDNKGLSQDYEFANDEIKNAISVFIESIRFTLQTRNYDSSQVRTILNEFCELVRKEGEKL